MKRARTCANASARQSAGQGFDEHLAEGLPDRRGHEHIGTAQAGGQLVVSAHPVKNTSGMCSARTGET
ncbi:MAG TPA: hypothetical protein VLQ92_05915, partial [Candidatus Limnocylindrales bacterium]|nr:hypothetical protein [Candidatus Limnocylindrales bacterium]